MTTWAELHAGDVILGHDAAEWQVVDIDHEVGHRFNVRIVVARGAERVTGWPDAAGTVTVVRPADTAAEFAACSALGDVSIKRESWENDVRVQV